MRKTIFILLLLSILSCERKNRFGATSDSSSCYLPLPKTMKIVYSELNDNYAIKYELGFVWFMKGLQEYTWHSEPITTFSDSCSAKEAAFEYIDQERRKKSYK